MEQKNWGFSCPLYRDPALELVRIVVRLGGYSSRHLHECKHNTFLVSKGRLQIWSEEEGRPEIRDVGPEDGMLTIPAGVPHQFLALEDQTVAYEFYTPASGTHVEPSDIVRFTIGGIRALEGLPSHQ